MHFFQRIARTFPIGKMKFTWIFSQISLRFDHPAVGLLYGSKREIWLKIYVVAISPIQKILAVVQKKRSYKPKQILEKFQGKVLCRPWSFSMDFD